MRGGLGDCLAVFSRIGGAVVNSGGNVALHCLAAAHGGRVRAVKINLMAALGKAFTNGERDAVFQIDIAACESYLCETRRPPEPLEYSFQNRPRWRRIARAPAPD